eukprot:SAG31_NODE_2750_length_5145_cov_2.649227_3_plen_141_part_00
MRNIGPRRVRSPYVHAMVFYLDSVLVCHLFERSTSVTNASITIFEIECSVPMSCNDLTSCKNAPELNDQTKTNTDNIIPSVLPFCIKNSSSHLQASKARVVLKLGTPPCSFECELRGLRFAVSMLYALHLYRKAIASKMC